jgi:hypothetical protein
VQPNFDVICLLRSAAKDRFQSLDASATGRKRSFKEDAVFWLVAGFDHSVITIKIASEVKMRNQIKEFLSWR